MIQKAKEEDFERINSVYKSCLINIKKINDPEYAANIQKSGFLIPLSTKEERRRRIKKSQIFKVYKNKDNILGFIDINKEFYFPENADNIIWFDQGLKNEYFHGNQSTVLHLVAVDPKYARQRIASKLLQSCLKELRKKKIKYLFSLVVLGPITNCPSLIFHHQHGFKRITTLPCLSTLFGFKDYQSLFFVKNL